MPDWIMTLLHVAFGGLLVFTILVILYVTVLLIYMIKNAMRGEW